MPRENQQNVRKFGMFLLLILSSIAFTTRESAAAPGDLDPTFSGDGKLTDSGSARTIAIQPDGKIVAAGPRILFRYLPDGSPDITFGGTGKVTIGYHDGFMGLQPDGKIVAAGLHDGGDFDMNGIALFRYNVDGSLDDTFGPGGRMIFYVDYGDCCALGDMVLSPAGGIFLVGTINGELWGFGFNADASFPLDYPTDVVLQQDGKKIVIGQNLTARFDAGGAVDTSFGGEGFVQNQMLSSSNAVAVQGDGKIIVAGCTSTAGEVNCDTFALVRYNPNGSLDTTFDGDGRVHTYFGGGQGVYEADIRSLAIEPSGKIIAAGSSEAGFSEGETDFTLVRYNPNGSLDTTFGGGDGISRVDFNNSVDVAKGMTLDAQGRAVVIGESDGAFAIARLLLDKPSAPFDYDGDGKSDYSVYRPADATWHLAYSGDGTYHVRPFGFPGQIWIVPADYDGDGITDIADIRCCSDFDLGQLGAWVIWNSFTNTTSGRERYFEGNERAVPADYDGDGKADMAYWNSSNGIWQIFLSESGWERNQQWGLPGDKPVPADFDGDGRSELVVWRPSEGRWYVLNIVDGGFGHLDWGLPGDIPIAGDFSGDGRADFGVYRPSDNTWHRLHTDDFSIAARQWGLPGDIPTPGDYDGDGRLDLAVYRPSENRWYALTHDGQILSQQFGLDGDIPTESAYMH